MNDVQNRQNSQNKFTMPRSLIWGGAIVAIVIAFALFLVVFMSSSETPAAFMAKWKSALESGDLKRYESLWIKSERQRPNSGYQNTVSLMMDDVNLEVNLGGASQPYRVPRYSNRFRIEAIPVTVNYPGEVQQQLRNLVIEKKGLVQQRWKIVRDEIVGSEFTATLPPSDPTQQTGIAEQPNSPVLPVVIAWKAALETQDLKAYTDLWDKSSRKRRAASFARAKEMMSQTHIIDLAGATYTAIPRHKTATWLTIFT